MRDLVSKPSFTKYLVLSFILLAALIIITTTINAASASPTPTAPTEPVYPSLKPDISPSIPPVINFSASEVYVYENDDIWQYVDILKVGSWNDTSFISIGLGDHTATWDDPEVVEDADFRISYSEIGQEFTSNETVRRFKVMILENGDSETPEYFDIYLHGPFNATIGSPGTCRVWITKDGKPPVSISGGPTIGNDTNDVVNNTPEAGLDFGLISLLAIGIAALVGIKAKNK